MSKRAIPDLLITWYKKNGRDYPWRRNTDPYRVLIAEIMLQRTKANQVVPVYLSFLKRFPNPKKLGEASKEEVARYFLKLGLIHRAELVKRLGEELNEHFHETIPETREELLSLPSVGEYVADAVLCFAFSKHVSIIDVNVCRVMQRVFDLRVKGEARRDPKLRKVVNKLLPRDRTKEFNWALLDLASLICCPSEPLCSKCPLNTLCRFAKCTPKGMSE